MESGQHHSLAAHGFAYQPPSQSTVAIAVPCDGSRRQIAHSQTDNSWLGNSPAHHRHLSPPVRGGRCRLRYFHVCKTSTIIDTNEIKRTVNPI